jgi:hypothetical protein
LKKKESTGEIAPSGKGFLPKIRKVASIVGRVSYLLLALPFKLPVKLLQAAKYVGMVAGVVQESTKDEPPRN